MTSSEFSYLQQIGYNGSLADKRNAYYNDMIDGKQASSYGTISVRLYGAKGDGIANDALAFDALIAKLNTLGSVNASANAVISVEIPRGVYNLKAGGIRALLVSNVYFNINPVATFLLKDGPVWTLGNSSTTVDNIKIIGGLPKSDNFDVLASTCCWVYAINANRVAISQQRFTRVQIFKGVSNVSLTSISISDFTGSGPPDRHWIEIDTSSNPSSNAAGLFLVNGGGYAYAPPINPAIVPKPISAATKTNPVQVTCAGHNLVTGARVRHGGVGGMTQLNGIDSNVTVVDANNYTLDGVDGTGFGTYTSGGWSAELLWSYPYDSAVVGIKGHWDTVILRGGLYQHWPWLWYVESQGTVSFLFDEEVTWDYGGKGRFNFVLNGGSVSNVKVNGGWHFCLNEEWIRISAPGAGYITDLTVQGHILGMTGRDFIDDVSLNKILNLCVDGLRILGMGRARIGQAFLIRPGFTGNNIVTLRRIRSENPGTYYGSSTYLLPDVGITLYQNTRHSLTDCEIYAATTNYVAAATSTTGAGQRRICGNKTYLGTIPEYITTASVTVPASAATTTNYTGLIQSIFLRGGTMTSAAKNGTQILSGAGPFSFDVMPGETWSVTYSVAPTLVISYRD